MAKIRIFQSFIVASVCKQIESDSTNSPPNVNVTDNVNSLRCKSNFIQLLLSRQLYFGKLILNVLRSL